MGRTRRMSPVGKLMTIEAIYINKLRLQLNTCDEYAVIYIKILESNAHLTLKVLKSFGAC